MSHDSPEMHIFSSLTCYKCLRAKVPQSLPPFLRMCSFPSTTVPVSKVLLLPGVLVPLSHGVPGVRGPPCRGASVACSVFGKEAGPKPSSSGWWFFSTARATLEILIPDFVKQTSEEKPKDSEELEVSVMTALFGTVIPN